MFMRKFTIRIRLVQLRIQQRLYGSTLQRQESYQRSPKRTKIWSEGRTAILQLLYVHIVKKIMLCSSYAAIICNYLLYKRPPIRRDPHDPPLPAARFAYITLSSLKFNPHKTHPAYSPALQIQNQCWGSGSACYWASRIWSISQRFGSGSRSFPFPINVLSGRK